MIKSRLCQDVFSDFPVAFFPVSAHNNIFFLHLIDVVTDAVYCDVSYGFGCFFGENGHFQAASHDCEFWRLESCVISAKLLPKPSMVIGMKNA